MKPRKYKKKNKLKYSALWLKSMPFNNCFVIRSGWRHLYKEEQITQIPPHEPPVTKTRIYSMNSTITSQMEVSLTSPVALSWQG